MTRRDFMKNTALAVTATGAATADAAQANRPNLLIIHTDEHSFRTLGCYRDTLPEEQAFVWGKGADEKSFTTDFLCDKTIDFIERHKSEPFCFMVSIPDPHGPNTVRPPYDTMFEHLRFQAPRTMSKTAAQTPKWATKQVNKLNNAAMARYFGMVKCIDDNVGKLLDALRKRGLIDNTIVVFTADHGDLCGEHGRHNKGVPYETSAKIPFVLRYPGKIKPGTVVRHALSCIDFLPTVLGLMGVHTAGREEGRDASTLFRGGNPPAGWQDLSIIRSTSPARAAKGNRWLAALTPRHKLVYSTSDDPWLFDLQTDPDELINRFGEADCREVVRELSQALIDYGREHGDAYVQEARIKGALAAALAA